MLSNASDFGKEISSYRAQGAKFPARDMAVYIPFTRHFGPKQKRHHSVTLESEQGNRSPGEDWTVTVRSDARR